MKKLNFSENIKFFNLDFLVSAYYELSQPNPTDGNDFYEADEGNSEEIEFVDYPEEVQELEAELEEDAIRHEAAIQEDQRFEDGQSDQDELMMNNNTIQTEFF